MRYAITTTFHGPTDRLGARISATNGEKSVTVSYPHHKSGVAAFAEAAIALCKKMDWHGTLVAGGLRKGGHDGGYVFVFVDSDKFKV